MSASGTGKDGNGHHGRISPRREPPTSTKACCKRHEHSGCDGQRFGLAELQHGAVAQHFSNGSSGFGQEPVSLEYCRAAHLVHHPGQQRRLHRAEKGNRFRGGHECRDSAGRRDVPGAGRGRVIRRTVETEQSALRPGLLRRARTTSWWLPCVPRPSCASWSRT